MLKKPYLFAGIAIAALAVAGIIFAPVLKPNSELLGSGGPLRDGVNSQDTVNVVARHADGTVFLNETHANLLTNAGKDGIAKQIGSASTASNGADYIGLTNTAITPAAGDTTLSGEITSNGLSRAQATYAHTNGTNTYTESKTFTATGTQAAQAAALFFGSSNANGGTMLAENTFTSASLINGDTLTVSWTVTMS